MIRNSSETVVWGAVAVLLIAFAIPWFLWGSDDVIAGLPVWVWWHVGWLIMTSVVFYVFAQTAWGVGIEVPGGEADG